MVYRGTYKNGVVVLDGQVDLPEGQRVRIDPEQVDSSVAPLSTTQKLAAAFGGIITDAPPDAARNHDHYLYGAEKRDSDS